MGRRTKQVRFLFIDYIVQEIYILVCSQTLGYTSWYFSFYILLNPFCLKEINYFKIKFHEPGASGGGGKNVPSSYKVIELILFALLCHFFQL